MAAGRVGYRDVFGNGEFRALWAAQLLSVAGDQLAKVALTLLVYDRTRSPFLAALTYAASVVPLFVGGLVLAGLADRWRRRELMVACDLVRAVLVAVMAVPGMPVAALVVLLFVVSLIGAPFNSARAALVADVLAGDRYVLGSAVTFTTSQTAQVAGFAGGGLVVAAFGVHASLLMDAATFLVSAGLAVGLVRSRAAAGGRAAGRPSLRGLRLTLGTAALRTPMLLAWLVAATDVYEGVAAPLAREAGGGAAATGLVLASGALGASGGAVLFGRLASPAARQRWMAPLAVAACGLLCLFATRPGLPGVLLILAVSGVLCAYQTAAQAAFVAAAPPARRSEAIGVAQAGMSLGLAVVMLAAGATAQWAAPTSVVAATGGAGALAGLAIALAGRRSHETAP